MDAWVQMNSSTVMSITPLPDGKFLEIAEFDTEICAEDRASCVVGGSCDRRYACD
jgi:hypothetical protein